MKAVILAAGQGNRMWPLTDYRPKVMLPLANLPILEHIIVQGASAGITDYVIVVGFRGDVICDYFKDGAAWNVTIEYVEQTAMTGTADALRMAKKKLTERFLVVNGDTIVSADTFQRVMAVPDLAIAGIQVDDISGLGALETRDGRVCQVREKCAGTPLRMANAGIYLLDPHVFYAIAGTGLSPRGEYELTDSVQAVIDDHRCISLVELEEWYDLSYPWNLLDANERLCRARVPEIHGHVEDYVVLKGPVTVGEGSIIRSGSYIEGPVVIGKNCRIGPNCYLRPVTSIGDDCHIGAAVEVKNSIIMSGSSLPHHNYVGDSVIGSGCNLGAGTKVANLRLDKGDVTVDGKPTHRRKLGAILGDGVQTGINASLNPGCVVGSGSFIGPGARATGIIQNRSRITA